VKLLFQHNKSLNGQNIAERMHISRSVVSKHLQQLKDVGIVRERSPDKRNYIYSIDLKTLRAISPGLLEVLRG
jgi:predicted transcriptional regulator